MANHATVRFPLTVAKSRPLNHPIRRLVSLCHLITDLHSKSLFKRCLGVWNEQYVICRKIRDYTLLRDSLMAQLPHYEDTYWNSHFLFEPNAANQHVPLMGHDLRQAVLVNTFMPLLYGHISDTHDSAQLQAFAQLFLSFRRLLAENEII